MVLWRNRGYKKTRSKPQSEEATTASNRTQSNKKGTKKQKLAKKPHRGSKIPLDILEQAEDYIKADVRLFSVCDESEESSADDGGACTSLFLQALYNRQKKGSKNLHPQLSYAQVLRQMKEGGHRDNYAQNLHLSSSRPLHMEQDAFDILPSLRPFIGTKRALLIGISYPETPHALTGSHDDSDNVRKYLKKVHGFEDRHIRVLRDDGIHQAPTKANVLTAFYEMAFECRTGDAFFFHFSGHGHKEEDGSQCLFPVDYMQEGEVLDWEVFQTLLLPLPEGVTMTAVVDCRSSGTVFALPFDYTLDNDNDVEECDYHNVEFPYIHVVKDFQMQLEELQQQQSFEGSLQDEGDYQEVPEQAPKGKSSTWKPWKRNREPHDTIVEEPSDSSDHEVFEDFDDDEYDDNSETSWEQRLSMSSMPVIIEEDENSEEHQEDRKPSRNQKPRGTRSLLADLPSDDSGSTVENRWRDDASVSVSSDEKPRFNQDGRFGAGDTCASPPKYPSGRKCSDDSDDIWKETCLSDETVSSNGDSILQQKKPTGSRFVYQEASDNDGSEVSVAQTTHISSSEQSYVDARKPQASRCLPTADISVSEESSRNTRDQRKSSEEIETQDEEEVKPQESTMQFDHSEVEDEETTTEYGGDDEEEEGVSLWDEAEEETQSYPSMMQHDSSEDEQERTAEHEEEEEEEQEEGMSTLDEVANHSERYGDEVCDANEETFIQHGYDEGGSTWDEMEEEAGPEVNSETHEYDENEEWREGHGDDGGVAPWDEAEATVESVDHGEQDGYSDDGHNEKGTTGDLHDSGAPLWDTSGTDRNFSENVQKEPDSFSYLSMTEAAYEAAGYAADDSQQPLDDSSLTKDAVERETPMKDPDCDGVDGEHQGRSRYGPEFVESVESKRNDEDVFLRSSSRVDEKSVMKHSAMTYEVEDDVRPTASRFLSENRSALEDYDGRDDEDEDTFPRSSSRGDEKSVTKHSAMTYEVEDDARPTASRFLSENRSALEEEEDGRDSPTRHSQLTYEVEDNTKPTGSRFLPRVDDASNKQKRNAARRTERGSNGSNFIDRENSGELFNPPAAHYLSTTQDDAGENSISFDKDFVAALSTVDPDQTSYSALTYDGSDHGRQKASSLLSLLSEAPTKRVSWKLDPSDANAKKHEAKPAKKSIKTKQRIKPRATQPRELARPGPHSTKGEEGRNMDGNDERKTLANKQSLAKLRKLNKRNEAHFDRSEEPQRKSVQKSNVNKELSLTSSSRKENRPIANRPPQTRSSTKVIGVEPVSKRGRSQPDKRTHLTRRVPLEPKGYTGKRLLDAKHNVGILSSPFKKQPPAGRAPSKDPPGFVGSLQSSRPLNATRPHRKVQRIPPTKPRKQAPRQIHKSRSARPQAQTEGRHRRESKPRLATSRGAKPRPRRSSMPQILILLEKRRG